MKYLFLHNNCPAQFAHIAKELAEKGNEVVFLANYRRRDIALPGVRDIPVSRVRIDDALMRSEAQKVSQELFLTGQSFGFRMLQLRKKGFLPDVVIAHPGWGGAAYVADIFPTAAFVVYAEWFYTKGELHNFFGGDMQAPSHFAANRQRNLYQLDALRECDAAIAPTAWQMSQYPVEFAPKLRVIHDGIDMDFFSPESADVCTVQGLPLHMFSEIVTYTTRGFEPYRGFPQFYRSIPHILKARPNCHVVIMGGDSVHYSAPRRDGISWRDALHRELPLDPDRVHFLNFGSYADYRAVLRRSTLHVYLTVPFVLSWSLLEAMSCSCLVLASATKPVLEVIQDARNGFLTPFGDSERLGKRAVELLAHAAEYGEVRAAARKTIVEKYDLKKTLGAQLAVIQSAVHAKKASRTGDDSAR